MNTITYKNQNDVLDLPLPIDEDKYSSIEIQNLIDNIFKILMKYNLIHKIKSPHERSVQLRGILKNLSGEYISRSDITIYLLNHGFKLRKEGKMNIKSFNLTMVQELFEASHGHFEFISKTNKAKFDLAKKEIDMFINAWKIEKTIVKAKEDLHQYFEDLSKEYEKYFDSMESKIFETLK